MRSNPIRTSALVAALRPETNATRAGSTHQIDPALNTPPHGGVAPLVTAAKPAARVAQRSSPGACRSHSRASHIATQKTNDKPSNSAHIPARVSSVPGSTLDAMVDAGAKLRASAKAMAIAGRMSRAESKRHAASADATH